MADDFGKEEAEDEEKQNLDEFYYDFMDRIFQGLDYYVNSTIKRHDYYIHYYETGIFNDVIYYN